MTKVNLLLRHIHRTARRVLPEADETGITGGVFRPAGSIPDDVNLYSAISFLPSSGVNAIHLLLYCHS